MRHFRLFILVLIIFIGVAELRKMGFTDYLRVIGKSIFGVTTGQKMFKGSDVDNFGKVDQSIYRGSRPNEEDYHYLSTVLKVKTIVDLTDDPKDWCASLARNLGLKYVNIPLSDKKYPEYSQVRAIESALLDEKLYPIFVHCNGGRHRTGISVGIYRLNKYNWTFGEIYKEMKQYDWYSEFGHGALKDFIKDYVDRNRK